MKRAMTIVMLARVQTRTILAVNPASLFARSMVQEHTIRSYGAAEECALGRDDVRSGASSGL